MIKRAFVILFCFVLGLTSFSQDASIELEGEVSYVTSQSIYVRFNSTENLMVGDTLYVLVDGIKKPSLVIKNLSSISSVCSPINNINLKVGDKISGNIKPASIIDNQGEVVVPPPVVITETPEQLTDTKSEKEKKKNGVTGKISLSSYSNITNTPMGNRQQGRYTFSISTTNKESIAGAEAYLSFVHSNTNWDEIRNDIFNGLKIYNLAVWIRPTKNTNITIGRKINRYISNVGSIDGIQVEQRIKDFTLGVYAGSRPDYYNYGYNLKLFQAGLFAVHTKNILAGNLQTVIGFSDQENNWNTDRRFLYLQHSNSIIKNLYFMGSMEVDLYQKVNDTITNNPKLTSLYLNLRYRFSRKISATISYRNQSSILYYHTYRDYITHISDDRNIQGVRLGLNIIPVKNLSIGLRAGYRNGNNDPRPSKNFNGYISYRNIPFLSGSVISGGYTYLESGYLNGNIFNANLSKDLLKGKIYATIGYRYVSYTYSYSDYSTSQNIPEISMNWRIMKSLLLTAAYEGTFDKDYSYNRIFLNLTWRY